MKYVEEQAKRAMVIYVPAWILTLAVLERQYRLLPV